MSKKWELLDERFYRALERACARKGELSLATIIEAQYFFPRKYPIKPKVVKINKPTTKQ
ncbi:hypothetical protein ACPV5G_16115 [Photobacterium damselae]|uniref:hypothetical protein n=1 Tax=Photobacterium damselae TaxID=38293 RepID=UPI00406803E2